MATRPQIVTNLYADPIYLDDVRAFDGTPIKLMPGVATDLLLLAADEDLAKSYHLSHLVLIGALSVSATFTIADTQALAISTIESGTTTLTGVKTFDGTVICKNDNSASFRLAGKDFYGADVQSYAGVYYNDQYDSPGLGIKKTRTIIGSNELMDIEIQGSHSVLLSAQDINFHDGFIKLGSNKTVDFHCYADGDTIAVKKLQVSRVDEVNFGDANTSDVEIKTSAGPLHINDGNGLGTVMGGTLTLDGCLITISGDNIVFSKGGKSVTLTMVP